MKMHDPRPNLRDEWRVGRRTGQKLWQVKQAPGWSVKFQGKDLKECAEFLIAQGADIRLISVLTSHPWKTLGEWIAIGTDPE